MFRPNLALASAALLLTACGGGSDSPTNPQGPETAAVARIEVTPASKTISYGESVQLSATAFDKDGQQVPNASISWSSDATEVATVSSEGQLTTTGVGSAKIIASSGGVEGNAAITVDYAHFSLSAAQASAPPFQVVTFTLPGGAPVPDTGAVLDATLGSDTVHVVVASSTQLALELPPVDAGTYELSVQLNEFSFGDAQLTVLAPPTVASPQAVLTSTTDATTEALDSLSAVGVGSAADVQAARSAVGSLQNWFQTASEDERLKLAEYLAATSGVAGVAGRGSSLAGGSPWAAATVTESYREGEEAELTTALADMETLMAQARASRLEACRTKGYASWECGSIAANTATLTLALLRGLPRAERLAEDPILPTDALAVRPASDAAAAEPFDLTNGVTGTLRVTDEHRSVSVSDLSGNGAAAHVAAAVQTYGGFWQDVDAWLAEVGPLLVDDFSLSGTPPELQGESATATLPIPSADLSLASTSSQAVSCSKDDAGLDLLFTCATDATEDQSFDFELDYASSALTASVTTSAVLHTASDPCANVGTLTLDGDAVQGELTDADCLNPDDRGPDNSWYYDTYTLVLTQETSFRFDATGTGMKPYISVDGSGGEGVMADAGNPMLSRLVLPAGSYEVRMYADQNALGSYTLSASTDANTANGCGRTTWIYFTGSVTHSGKIVDADCSDVDHNPADHWDGYFTWVSAGETVSATLHATAGGTLSIWRPGDSNPNVSVFAAGYVSLSFTATQEGYMEVYPLARPEANMSYTISLSVRGAASAPPADQSPVAGPRPAPRRLPPAPGR